MAGMRTLEQVRARGLRALARELGPTDLVRFLQHSESGSGDYTVERHGMRHYRATVRQITEGIRRGRAGRGGH